MSVTLPSASRETALTMYFIRRAHCSGVGLLRSRLPAASAGDRLVNRGGRTHVRYYRGSLSLRLAAERDGRSHPQGQGAR
jgi:hypothetical protein